MGQKEYVVEGRRFRTESDYACALRDKELIDKLRLETDFQDRARLEALQKELRGGKYRFRTLLGQDFKDEVYDRLKNLPVRPDKKHGKGQFSARPRPSVREEKEAIPAGRASVGRELSAAGAAGRGTPVSRRDSAAVDEFVQEELRKMEERRRLILIVCGVLAMCCLGYCGIYFYHDFRTKAYNRYLSDLRDDAAGIASFSSPSPSPAPSSGPLFTLDDAPEEKAVLEEYKPLLQQNQKLIGWVKIDGTNIDYPVMQTTDNEYYLSHNMNQEKDPNGTIFMDKDCDVLKPSTNFILYGHHMKSGNMFGRLNLYQEKSYGEKHPYIQFDTIYEKGVYQVMYVFRSRVYSETAIVFKYYQFIDANGQQEFDSYMQEMAELSLYDTGVTAEYGDRLLTLSTCDYQEKDGRFVVVAKRISEDE